MELVKGFSYTSSEKFKKPTDYVFVTLNNIRLGGGFKTKYFWLKSSRIKDKHFVKEMDLILANIHFGVGGANVARLLGCVAFVIFPYDYQKEKGVFSLDVSKIIPKSNELKYYLYFLLKQKQGEIASTYHKGTSIRRLDENGFLKQLKIIIPSKTILCDFERISYLIWKEISENKKQKLVLTNILDHLLPKLMLGKYKFDSN